MRKSTLLWLALAAFCGTVLFHTSQKVHDEREKLGALNISIAKEEESLRVLNAEWSYLNQPARLEKLAKTYLKLAPLKGSQFVKAEDIPLRGAPAEIAAAAPIAKPVTTAKSRTAAAESLRPSINIFKPAAVFLQKTARPVSDVSATTATNARNFNDVMKNLRQGVEQ